jgi:hypothetical protein
MGETTASGNHPIPPGGVIYGMTLMEVLYGVLTRDLDYV